MYNFNYFCCFKSRTVMIIQVLGHEGVDERVEGWMKGWKGGGMGAGVDARVDFISLKIVLKGWVKFNKGWEGWVQG